MFHGTSRFIAVLLFSVLMAAATTVQGAVTVQPGEVVSFSTVDSGEVDCRWKDLTLTNLDPLDLDLINALDIFDIFPDVEIGCAFPPFFTLVPIPGAFPPLVSTTTWWNNGASAAYSSLVGYNITDWGVPFYANGGVYNEFVVADPEGEGGLVDIQVSMVYDADGAIGGVGMFDAGVGVMLEVEDVSGGGSRIVGSMELLSRDLNGGQGLELGLEAGSLTFDQNGDTANFDMTVQRGRTYRIWLKTEAYGQPWVLTELETSVRAAWHELTLAVSGDEDVAGLIEQHDEDIKTAIGGLETGISDLADDLAAHDANIDGDLAAHDAAVQQQLSVHDTEIKARLDQIEAKLDTLMVRQLEIVRLLHVPEGQRSTEVPACDGGPCEWGDKPKK